MRIGKSETGKVLDDWFENGFRKVLREMSRADPSNYETVWDDNHVQVWVAGRQVYHKNATDPDYIPWGPEIANIFHAGFEAGKLAARLEKIGETND